MGILRGLQGVVELQAQRRWSRDGGWQTIRTFRARTKPDLEALVTSVQATALDFTITEQNGPVGTLVATFGDQQSGEADESTQTTFELLSEDTEERLFNSYRHSLLSDSDKAKLREYIKRTDDGEEVTTAFSDSTNGNLLFRTYKLSDSYNAERWVLRKTQTIGSFYRVRLNVVGSGPSDLDVSLAGVGTIFTTAQLIAFETAMPTSIVSALNYYSAPPARADFLWGWKKKIPTLVQKAGNKLEATVDYQLDFWPSAYFSQYA